MYDIECMGNAIRRKEPKFLRWTIELLVFLLFVTASLNGAVAQQQTTVNGISASRISDPAQSAFEIGHSVSGIGDIDGDGFMDVAIGAPSFDPGGDLGLENRNGAVFLVSGKLLQHEESIVNLAERELMGWAIVGHSESRIGEVVTSAGDVNADGFSDFAFSAQGDGSVYILYGGDTLPRLMSLNEFSDYGVRIEKAGGQIAYAGDFDGDGFSDVAVSNPKLETDSGGQVGRLSMFFGAESHPQTLSILDLPSIFGLPGTRLGASITGGFTLAPDGFHDLFVLEPEWGDDKQGRAFIIEGADSLESDFGQGLKTPFMVSPANGYVRYVNDVNGDGLNDLVVGSDDKTAWLILGRDSLGGKFSPRFMNDDPLTVRLNGADSIYAGHDLNGDGIADLVATVPNAAIGDRALCGRVVILFGQTEWPGEVRIDEIIAGSPSKLLSIVIDGPEEFSLFGASAAGVYDLQGDGFDDLLIGAPGIRDPSGLKPEKPGAAYVIQGRSLFFMTQTQRSDVLTRGSD